MGAPYEERRKASDVIIARLKSCGGSRHRDDSWQHRGGGAALLPPKQTWRDSRRGRTWALRWRRMAAARDKAPRISGAAAWRSTPQMSVCCGGGLNLLEEAGVS